MIPDGDIVAIGVHTMGFHTRIPTLRDFGLEMERRKG
jgi:hypothetical protein